MSREELADTASREESSEDIASDSRAGRGSRRTILTALLGIGGLSTVGGSSRANASPPGRSRPWKQDVDAKGNDLSNLGSLAMAANNSEIIDFEGDGLSVNADGVLNADMNSETIDLDKLDDLAGRYLELVLDEPSLIFTGSAEWSKDSSFTNDANGHGATIGGGTNNTIEGYSEGATISGGRGNSSEHSLTTIGGGENNAASRLLATISGGKNNTVTGGWSTIGGGTNNEVHSRYATIAGGTDNKTTGNIRNPAPTIGGGTKNEAGGKYATVAGGGENEAKTRYGTIAGGFGNEVTASYKGHRGATVGGGSHNTASEDHSTISGGRENTASTHFATIPGGEKNTADGEYSFAVGRKADTNGHDGAVVFADSSDTEITAGAADEAFFQMPVNATSFSNTSSRAKKTSVESVDTGAVLDSVNELDITTWTYTDTNDGRHMGPMAEAFHDAFKLGQSAKRINTVDADGVTMAAIQGLSEKLDDANDEIEGQSERINELESEVETKDDRIESLESEQDRLRERLNTMEERFEGQNCGS